MPTQNDASLSSANEFIESQLDARLTEIEKFFTADAVSISGPLLFNVDNLIRKAVERRVRKGPRRRQLVVVLTTKGGSVEVVRRTVDVFRHHYKLVDFVIPDHAYSAGTVLAMSGDAIHMDYYSRLGPIDPQVESQGGRWVSALGYLERYNELIEKAQDNTITAAEVQVLMGFDQGDLYLYEQARDLSITLLEEWLVKYKFKNWRKTETNRKPVTKDMKEGRARKIAETLNDTNRWHLHGHGISMAVLEKDVNLKIDDFGKNTDLNAKIKSYHGLLDDYMSRLSVSGVVHTQGFYRQYF